MSQVRSNLRELANIEYELKSIRQKMRKLNTRKEFLKNGIIAYCKANNLPGVKDRGIVILVEEKTSHTRKRKKEKEHDQLQVLREHGIHNPETVLQEMIDASRGEQIAVDKLKIQKYKR